MLLKSSVTARRILKLKFSQLSLAVMYNICSAIPLQIGVKESTTFIHSKLSAIKILVIYTIHQFLEKCN